MPQAINASTSKKRCPHRGTIILQNIPMDTKRIFKTACAAMGLTQRDVLITLIQEVANRNIIFKRDGNYIRNAAPPPITQ